MEAKGLTDKRFLVSMATILVLVASTTPIHEALAYQPQDPPIQGKFRPRFAYDYLCNLSIDNPNKIMSANVWLVENEEKTGVNTARLKQHVMEILSTQHNAEISYCPKKLSFISIMATATEIKKIAAYEFTDRISISGDFVRPYLCLDISVPSIRANDVWNLGYDGSDVTIAILDTGISQSHPDLEGQVILEQDFTGEGITWDTDGHGTHVAGIVAGTGASSNGVYRGVAPGAKLLDARVMNSSLKMEITWFENAIAWAVDNGADIISCSLAVFWKRGETQIRTDGTLAPSPAADAAVAQGVAFVAAAGNYHEEGNPENYIGAPGDAFNVITVGVSDDEGSESIDDDTLPWWSSRGPTGDDRIKPDVVAPGVDIMSTSADYSAGDDYEPRSGTSMATAHVAGVAALMLQARPDWKGKPIFVKSVLERTARLNNNLAQLTENDRGTGIVDALQAIHNGIEIPVAPADRGETYTYSPLPEPDYTHAEVNKNNAVYRLEVGTPVHHQPDSDSYAWASLFKDFVPEHTITNPTFYFRFHVNGWMDAQIEGTGAYTYLNAFLGLWHNENILFGLYPQVQFVSEEEKRIDFRDEIFKTYTGELLEGETYTIEYGFSVFEHEAHADFAGGYRIKASWIIKADNYKLTVRTYDLGNNEKTDVDVWIDSTHYSSPVEDLIVACGDHIVEVDSVFCRPYYYEYTFQHWEDGDTSNPRIAGIFGDTTLKAYYKKEYTGGAGGCPFVCTWNGTGYAIDNNLLGDSETSGGADVEDYYRLEQPLVRREGKYWLLIREFEQEHSNLDEVSLMAVDHESNVHVAVTPTGEILTYRNPAAPMSAVDNNGTTRLNELSLIDGDVSDPSTYFHGEPEDYVTLDFGNVDVSDGAKLVFRANVHKKKADPGHCIHLQILNETESWADIKVVRTRETWSTLIVDLLGYLPDANGELKVRLYFTSIHRLDYVGLDTTKQDDFDLHHANLVSATHSEDGSVKSQLLESDNVYAELVPIQQIELTFTLPENSKDTRTFITHVEGHYYIIG
jgi:subtilisin family serine protease